VGLLTPVGILQGGRSSGKTSSRGSLSLGGGPGLEGKSWCCCFRVRKKPVTLSADGSTLRTLTRCAGTDSTAWEETSPSAVMWQGAHPSQGAAGEEEGTQHACIPPRWRDNQPASRLSPKHGPWQAILLDTQPQHGVSGAQQGCPCWVLVP